MKERSIACPLFLFLLLSSAGIECSISSTFEEIRRPHAVVQRLFEQASQAGTVRGDFGVVEHFEKTLEGKWDQVPLLNDAKNVEEIGDGVLVRFRGMIQNIMNIEFYVKSVKIKEERTGEVKQVSCKYKDSFPSNMLEIPDVSDSRTARKLGERTPCICFPIPGETDWVKKAFSACAPPLPLRFEEEEVETKEKTSGKRTFEPGEETGTVDAGEETKGDGAEEVKRQEEALIQQEENNSSSIASNRTLKPTKMFVLRAGNQSSVLFPEGFSEEQARELVSTELARHPDWKIEVASPEDVEDAHKFIPTVQTEAEIMRRYQKFPDERKKGEKRKKKDELRWAFGHDQFGSKSAENGEFNPGQQYLMKLYDIDRKHIDILQVAEFVGILSFDAVGTVFKDDIKEAYNEIPDEIFSLNMVPTSVLPRVHVLFIRQLSSKKKKILFHPLITKMLSPLPPLYRDLISKIKYDLPALKSSVISILRAALDEDDFAAQYVFYCMISKMNSAADGHRTPGKFSVGLKVESGAKKKERVVERLHRALCSLLPMVQKVKVSSKSLNSGTLLCKRNLKSDLISACPFQAPRGCLFLLDHDDIAPSGVTGLGYKSMMALKAFHELQVLNIDMENFKTEIVMNNPVVSVTCVDDSPLDRGCDLTLNLEGEEGEEVGGDLDPLDALLKDEELLHLCRAYLGYVRDLDPSVGEETANFLMEEWTKISQGKGSLSIPQEFVNPGLFDVWINLFQLIAISRGEAEGTAEVWSEVEELERKRLKHVV